MSGILDYEKQGLFDLFNGQEDKGILIQLAKSLTKNYVSADNLDDALQIVFVHGGSSTTILNKKMLTKEILFKYLHKNSVRASSDFTKSSLIEKTQNFWKEKFFDNKNQNESSLSEVNPNSSHIDQQNVLHSASQPQNEYIIEQNNQLYKTDLIQNDFPIQQNNQLSTNNSMSYPINLLAKKFSEWFFVSYNDDTLKPQDFWIDSSLHLKMVQVQSGETQEHQCTSSTEVVETLLGIKNPVKFSFNPNLAYEGVQGRLDMHGLVLVLCCGTLHTTDTCMGTFESLFGLIRDPNCDNNWKIKHLKLILKSTAVINQIPCLVNSDTLSEVLSLPEPSGNI
ncbi:uncharacterized protein C3orf38 homolog [Condylostylus longicornis]|uniref:uncharacterized protein C3orf38 homolog n=1 Tax=Condylostylus longicornis TaxID=2530218 RepID=UPI00244E55EE|nr:uncharacterized protein C3orf38 homolog [Condylostylus longicornis]